jgi:hypothetical protein
MRAVLAILLLSAATAAADSPQPVYVPERNPHEYTLFANGGWDGNWYVGYDTCWVRKLPALPAGNFERAYLGARVGRAKLQRTGKAYHDISPIPASLYIALSDTTTWKKEHTYPLVQAAQLPWEPSFEETLTGVGESDWFWTEVPLAALQSKRDLFIALGASTPGFVSVSSSPILAAAWGNKSGNTWIIRNLKGAPPEKSQAMDAISVFDPAIVLKLIPKGPSRLLKVQLHGWTPGTVENPISTILAHVSGDAVTRVWLEAQPAAKKTSWLPIGQALRKPPYRIPVPQTQLPLGRVRLRVGAANEWEDVVYSTAFTVEVGTAAIQTK